MDELSYHYSMLISYCMIKNSLFENELYDTELFKIYNSFLKRKLFLDKKTKHIDDGLYRNILILSLRLKKFSWAFCFIKNYSKFLHPEKSKNLINLSFAQYYYQIGSHNNSSILLNKAFNYLKEIQEESFIIKYDIRTLYLMLYYDLGYTENLIEQLNNYRKFLHRNDLVTNERKKQLNKFLNILEKLTYLREGNPAIDLEKLNLDIMRLKKFNYQGWLLDKVQEYNMRIPYSKLKMG